MTQMTNPPSNPGQFSVADPGVDADATSGAGNIFCVTRVFFNQRLHSQDGFCITQLNLPRKRFTRSLTPWRAVTSAAWHAYD